MPYGVGPLLAAQPGLDLADPEPQLPAHPEAVRAAALAAQVVDRLDGHPQVAGQLGDGEHGGERVLALVPLDAQVSAVGVVVPRGGGGGGLHAIQVCERHRAGPRGGKSRPRETRWRL